MKKFLLIFLLMGSAVLAQADSASTGTVQGQIADWSLIQAQGGLTLGIPIQVAAHSWKLPIECDLTGNSSGIVIRKTTLREEGKDFILSLEISRTAWTLTPERGKCIPVVIESSPGGHEVLYRDASGKTTHVGFAYFNLDSAVLNSPGG